LQVSKPLTPASDLFVLGAGPLSAAESIAFPASIYNDADPAVDFNSLATISRENCKPSNTEARDRKQNVGGERSGCCCGTKESYPHRAIGAEDPKVEPPDFQTAHLNVAEAAFLRNNDSVSATQDLVDDIVRQHGFNSEYLFDSAADSPQCSLLQLHQVQIELPAASPMVRRRLFLGSLNLRMLILIFVAVVEVSPEQQPSADWIDRWYCSCCSNPYSG
jgi:hypothetical protein